MAAGSTCDELMLGHLRTAHAKDPFAIFVLHGDSLRGAINGAGTTADTILARTAEIRVSSSVFLHIRKMNRIHAHLVPAYLDTPSATDANIAAQAPFCFLNRATV